MQDTTVHLPSMFKAVTPGRCLLFLFVISCVLVFTVIPLAAENGRSRIVPRQVVVPSVVEPSTGSPTQPPSTTSTTTTPVSTSTPSTSSERPPSSQALPSSTSTGTTTTPTNAQSSPPSEVTPQIPPSSSLIETTDANGQPTVVFVTVSPSSGSSSSSSPAASGTQGSDDDSSSGLSTGSIIGLSVCVGVAAIGIIGFIVWKFTRKRKSDSFDDADGIKWPELNSDNHSPTNPAHGAAFLSASDVNLARGDTAVSGYRAGYTPSVESGSQSHVDLYSAQDPYAVPPLPHLNPSQPYRDDPNTASYYDPYPGNMPHDSRPSTPVQRGDMIPMTQIPGNRARSPGPQMAMSPGPGASLHGPVPPGYGSGRQSPGPHDAYGYGR